MAETVTTAPETVPNDTGFTRTLAARTESVLDSLERPSTGIKEFTEDDFDPNVSVFDSFASAFVDSGIITGIVRSVTDQEDIGADDPDYDIEADLKSRPEDLKFLQPFLDNPTDPASGSLLARLADSRNSAMTARIIRQAREAQERYKEANANGWLPALAGTLSGIGLDVAASIGLTAMTGVGGLGVLTARTATSGRALAAGRVAGFGAAEGLAERGAQQLTNPLIADEDLLEAAGFGAGAAGLLGFAFPTLIGNVRRIRDDITVPQILDDEAIEEARVATGRAPLSAMRTPGVDEKVVEPAKGSGSIAARAVPKSLQEGVLRNPKRVIADIGARGAKAFREKKLEGGRKFFDVMSRVVRMSTVMQDEVGGEAARVASVQDIRDQFRAVRLAREETARREYSDMMRDVFNAGSIKQALRNSNLIAINKHLISQEQFEAMADELAILRSDPTIMAGEDIVIPDEIARRLTPEQKTKLMGHLRRAADSEDEYYQRFGELEVKHGLIKEEELIPGYRPQRWNREEIEADPQGFQQFLLEVFSKQPDEDWVRKSYQLRKEDGTFEPVLQPGETFAQLSKRDPDLANRILDDWGAAIKQTATEKAFVIREARERELKKVRGKVALEVYERINTRLSRDQALLAKVEQRMSETTDAAAKAKLADRITRIEKRIAERTQRLEVLKVQSRTAEGLDNFLLRFGNAEQKRAIKKAIKRVEIAARREARVEASKIVSEQIDAIRRAILDGDSPFGFIDDQFIQTSSRFKRRSIHLHEHRFRPEARRFLHTSTHDARAAYDSSVGVQVALREVFGPIFEKEGEKFSLEALRARALAGYDNDLRKVKGDKDRRELMRDRERAKRIFDHILEEMTHADLASLRGVRRSVSDLVSITNTMTAAMSLGSVVLAQIGDLAVQIMAGGRIGTGFRMMWRRGVVKHIREIAKDDAELAVLLQGPSVVDASRFRALAEIDTTGFDIPGSRFRNIMRKTDEIAKIEGWANLMHVWNVIVRGGFGLDFARQIDKDLANYARLPPYLKTYYAKLGIDAQDARDMADLMNRAHRTAVNGKLRIPHSSVWAEQRPDLLMKYRIAIKAAGDEAMIDPGVADRPFLRSFAGGRLLLQFQSFMFTAGERFVAPLIQELQLHPTSIRPYVASLAGMYIGAITDGLKAAVRGEFEEWADRWEDDEGWRDNLWGALMRSPMMAGPSAMLTDVGLSAFGRVLNDRLEDITGTRPLRQEATRFREHQGLFALFGPAAGMVAGTLPAIARRYLEGDVDEATAIAARRLPIANVFYLHMLTQLAGRE